MPKGPKGEKRPADVNARAVMIAKIATGAVDRAFAKGLKPCEFGGPDGTTAVAKAVLNALAENGG